MSKRRMFVYLLTFILIVGSVGPVLALTSTQHEGEVLGEVEVVEGNDPHDHEHEDVSIAEGEELHDDLHEHEVGDEDLNSHLHDEHEEELVQAILDRLEELNLPVLPNPDFNISVALQEEQYEEYGRVFPDPQGGYPQGPGVSPYAKGNVPATQFIQFNEAIEGLSFLEQKFPDRMKMIRLDEHYSNPDFMSAGIGDSYGNKNRLPLYMVHVTDFNVEQPKKRMVFSLSMHGIERAGIEGGLRAIEDLVSASLEDKLTLEEDSITMGEALKQQEVYFLLINPDGWKRGDVTEAGLMYQRYNGNGVDVNRDWPIKGYTYHPYSPGSEPETKAYMKALKDISEKWDGGADLHGMLNADAFTYTMLPAGEIDYFKNKRVLNLVQQIHVDAQKRLSWSPLIVEPGSPLTGTGTAMIGQQWGTIWDTLNYTVTGDFGNWAGTSIGLDGDVIDNEMAFSHLSNDNNFIPIIEQMHVDGNKGLIYTQMEAAIKEWSEQEKQFSIKGKTAVLDHKHRKVNAGGEIAQNPYDKLPAQGTIRFSVDYPLEKEYEFTVKGPQDNVYSKGMEITARGTSVNGVTPVVPRMTIWHYAEDHGNWGWTQVAQSFNQSPLYLQSGAIVSLNNFEPGKYKVTFNSDVAEGLSTFRGEIKFSKGTSYDQPIQEAYDVTNIKFFDDLNQYISEENKVDKLSMNEITIEALKDYDTLILANHMFEKGKEADETLKKSFVEAVGTFVINGGNLVLTDEAIQLLAELKLVDSDDIMKANKYAGFIQFQDYDHYLADNINQPGAAEGTNNRRQTYEPVPLGYSLNQNSSPVWRVSESAWSEINGTTVGYTDTGWTSYGEANIGKGKIRIIGALLPDPTTEFYHPNGITNYALTWSGYELLANMLDYTKE